MRILSSNITKKKNRLWMSYLSTSTSLDMGDNHTAQFVRNSSWGGYMGGATRKMLVGDGRVTIADVTGKGILTYILAPRGNTGGVGEIRKVWVTIDGLEYYFDSSDEVHTYGYAWMLGFNVPPINRNASGDRIQDILECLVMGWGIKFNTSLKIEFESPQTYYTTTTDGDYIFTSYCLVDDFDNFNSLTSRSLKDSLRVI
jgi:hypothetical protein